MFWFIKKIAIGLLSVCTIGIFGDSLVSNSKGTIKWVSLRYYASFNFWKTQIFTADGFFLSEKEIFNWTYLLKKTPQRTKILISPVWNKVLKIWGTLFELMNIEVHCSKN